MALNDLINGKLRVLGLGLILSCSGASDENISGCKNDSECKGNRYCIDGECVEGSGNGSHDTVGYDSIQECDPYDYQNQCQNGVLTYCDVVSRKPKQMDCYAEGFPHCDYVDVFENSICFGNGGQGSSCHNYEIGSDLVITSECDYKKVDICIFGNEDDPNEGRCRTFCQTDSDCPKEYGSCYTNSDRGYDYCTHGTSGASPF